MCGSSGRSKVVFSSTQYAGVYRVNIEREQCWFWTGEYKKRWSTHSTCSKNIWIRDIGGDWLNHSSKHSRINSKEQRIAQPPFISLRDADQTNATVSRITDTRLDLPNSNRYPHPPHELFCRPIESKENSTCSFSPLLPVFAPAVSPRQAHHRRSRPDARFLVHGCTIHVYIALA